METLPTKSLADVQQVHHENQGLTGLNDRASATVTVRHVGGNLQATTAADLHAEQTLIPAADNLANAHLEGQRLAAVPRSVELFAGRECNTNVVGEHAGAGNNLSACALDQVGDDQLGGGVALGEIDFGLFAVEVTLTERHGCLL